MSLLEDARRIALLRHAAYMAGYETAMKQASADGALAEKLVKTEAPMHFEGAQHLFSKRVSEEHHACKGEGYKECKK